MSPAIDVTEIIGTTLGLMIPLIPVVGLTLRFTLKPLIEAYAKARAPMGEIPRLMARVQLLEAELAALQPRAQPPTPITQGQPLPRFGDIDRS